VQSDLRAEQLESLGLEFERSYAALHSYLVPGGDDLPGQSRVIVLGSRDEVRQICSEPFPAFFRSSSSLLGSTKEIVFSDQERGAAMEVFRHELTHRFVAHYFPDTPRWVNEGLAQFLRAVSVQGDEVVVGAPPGHYTFDGWQWKLWRTPFADVWPRLDELRERTGYLEAPEYAAAWALVHTLLLGEPRHRLAFGGYMGELRDRQLDQPAAFAKHIDAAMLAELSAAYRAFPKRGNLATETIKLRRPTPQLSSRAMSRAEAYALWGGIRDRNPLQHALALQDAEEAIKSDASAAAGYLLRGTLRYEDKQGEAALRDLRQAVSLEPRKREAVRALASLLLVLKGATPEVRQHMETLRGVARAGDDYNALARWALAEQQPERALEDARRAIDADPGCATCYQTAAIAKARQLDFAGAVRYQKVAVNLSAEFANAGVVEILRSFDAARLDLAAPAPKSVGLTRAVVNAVVAANFAAFAACRERALESKPGTSSSLALHVDVDARGAVTRAEQGTSTLKDATSAACILEKVKAVRFPPPSGGATTLRFRIGFRQ